MPAAETSPATPSPVSAEQLAAWVADARERTLELVADLRDDQLWGPRLWPTINPLIWEVAHAAWFHEKRVLQWMCQQPPIRADADSLWDSIAIPHHIRWDLPHPSRAETLAYLHEVRDRELEQIRRRGREGTLDGQFLFYALYAVFHEDMHTEALTYTRQTLAYPAPHLSLPVAEPAGAGPFPGDVQVPSGRFLLGAPPDEPFSFDNERPPQWLEVQPFKIARAPVTQAEFAAFVDDGGYRRRDLWSDDGWRWREEAGAEHPVYWRRRPDGGWERRNFDRWVALEPHRPVLHVNWYEAEAYCRWAGRRLPTELEWEVAAAGEPAAGGGLAVRKRRYPWGNEPPSPERANLDWRAMGCADVGAFAAGDSAFGCRQMIGNVWEWTSSTLLPFPGFVADEAYDHYSEPWFGTRKVLRGGCWATRSRLIRNAYRNFYTPDRRDVWAGFRTCAL